MGKIHNVEKEMLVTKQMFENNFDLAKKSFYSSRRLQSSSYLLIIVKIQLNVSVNGKWAQGNPPLPSKWTHLIEQENVEMTFTKLLLLGKDLRCDLNLLCRYFSWPCCAYCDEQFPVSFWATTVSWSRLSTKKLQKRVTGFLPETIDKGKSSRKLSKFQFMNRWVLYRQWQYNNIHLPT